MRIGFRISISAALCALLFVLAAPRLVQAEDAPVVGVWDCVSETPDGGEYKFVLTVKKEDDKFVVTAGTDEASMTIAEFSVDGPEVSFKATVGDEDYTVKIKVDGTAFEGKWSGGDASGSIKGSKRS